MDSLIPRGGLRGGWRGALEMKGGYQIKSASLEKQPVYLSLWMHCVANATKSKQTTGIDSMYNHFPIHYMFL